MFVAQAHKILKKKIKNLITIIIPRHAERYSTIKNELEKLKINIIGIACIVDRSSEKIFDDHEIISLLKLDIPVYEPENIPEELRNIPAIKPGSRVI